MPKTAAPKTDERQRPVENRVNPIDDAAEKIRADARVAPRTYARDSEVPGGGE